MTFWTASFKGAAGRTIIRFRTTNKEINEYFFKPIHNNI